MRVLKQAVHRILNRFGYMLIRADWLPTERAAVARDADEKIAIEKAAVVKDAEEKIAIEKAAAVKFAENKIAAEKAHAAILIEEARRSSEYAVDLAAVTAGKPQTYIGATTARPPAQPIRPLEPILPGPPPWGPFEAGGERIAAGEMLQRIAASGDFARHVLPYFAEYPSSSRVSALERAYLYALVRGLPAVTVAEIGTMFAGTAEVLARAVWENGDGLVHTIDPFGAGRIPPILGRWPKLLRPHVLYHAATSMSFFARAADVGLRFDLVLVDGNHDFEYALFDIQMAARLMTPGGLIVVDNVEQTGPFTALHEFRRIVPGWLLLGGEPDPDRPFAPEGRAFIPDAKQIILQAPAGVVVGARTVASGQTVIKAPAVSGIGVRLKPGAAGGTLRYRAILRAFTSGSDRIDEFVAEGAIDVEAADAETLLTSRFDAPLDSRGAASPPHSHYTFEVELAWRSDAGELRLKEWPTAVVVEAQI